MDSKSQNQRQDDILSSFFPGDYVPVGAPGTDVHQPHHHQLSQQCEPQSRGMFQFTDSSSSSSQLASETPKQMDVAQQYPSQPQASAQSQTQINLDMLGDLLPMSMPGMDLNSSQDSNSNSTLQMVAGEGQLGYIPQVIIDHQFRLSQLHQLQQLQQHIFQQQIALLSGQVLNGAPTFDAQRDQSLVFNGIPTPAPSGELRPQQQSLDFIAPMALNSFGENASKGHSSGMSLPNSPATLHSAPGSVTSSPVFLASNDGHPSSNTFSTYVQAGRVSALEHAAFQNHGLQPATDLDLDISPLTSPWLGAQPNQPVPPLPSQLQNKGQSRQNQKFTRQQSDHRSSVSRSSASSSPSPSQGGPQYPSTPITGPITTSNNTTNTNANNKRSASPSSTETDARKRQSPAVRPTNPSVFSPYLDQQPSIRRSNRTSTRSSPTSSTPHLRGRSASTRQRKGSTAATPTMNEVPGDSPSPVDLSMPPPAPPVPPNSAVMGSSRAVTPLTPVTPASIMNLDMKGKRLKIVTDNSVGVSPTSPATSRSKRGAMQGNMVAGPSLISPSLKPILPGPSNILSMTPASSTNSSHPSPAMSASSSIVLPQVRKTSHKAAEQKRRDSLKTTFDELRGLLPPIPLPSTPGTGHGYDEDGGANSAGIVASGAGSSGGSASTAGIIFGNAVKPLLPGALPPRGPPKVGGEGPNKGVSKLQLLICGNEYIRTLNARVERRDEEIARLRREVRKLRQLRQLLGVVTGIQAANSGFEGRSAGGGQGGAGIDLGTMGVEGLLEELDLELDLDWDIDAVEKIGGLGNEGSGRRDDLLSSARSDITMDEDPGEDYED